MVKEMRIIGTLAILLLSQGCVSGAQKIKTENLKVAPPPLLLGEGDVVDVQVYREPELRGTYRINPAGEIEFPLIGKVSTRGMDAESLAAEIRTRLAQGYLTNPQVSVFVLENNSGFVHVIGEVENPGSFNYKWGMNVLQAISAAGGFTKLAASSQVRITRTTPDGEEKIFELKVGDKGSGAAQNFMLMAGDVVYTPESIF